MTKDDYQFLAFVDGGVLFNESQQTIFLLNPSAAFIWCTSFDTNNNEELSKQFAETMGITFDLATNAINLFFDSLASQSTHSALPSQQAAFIAPLNHPSKPNQKPPQIKPLTLGFNDVKITLYIESPILIEELKHLFNPFILDTNKPVNSNPEISIQVLLLAKANITNDQSFDIYLNHECVASDLLFNSITPYIIGVISESIYSLQSNSNLSLLMFHAVMLTTPHNKTCVIPINSKPETNRLLNELSFSNHVNQSNDTVIVDTKDHTAHTAHTNSLPIVIKNTSTQPQPKRPKHLGSYMRHHDTKNQWVRYRPISNKRQSNAKQNNIDAFIFPAHNKANKNGLESLDKHIALKLLLESGSSGRLMEYEDIQQIITMLEKLPCYTLHYTNTSAVDINVFQLGAEA